MAFEDYQTKQSVVVVYTGEGKGKTSAAIGLMGRALGAGWKVAVLQFIKHWEVSEHEFIRQISPIFGDRLVFFKGGKGFYNANDLSAKDITEDQHIEAAKETMNKAFELSRNGDFDLVICDEINNAVHDGLITRAHLRDLIELRNQKTSLCLTGRNFPTDLIKEVDIASEMTKLKHHYDDKYLANKGIDY